MVETRTVTIPSKAEHEGFYSMTISLPWVCPVCGNPRGEPEIAKSYDGSLWMHVNIWHNPCGHIDSYVSVREEYRKLHGVKP